ncbi:MAG: hypothetical protein KGJ01_02170, partial [Patescibacteria group bacterium]|nr:hypothetical protein [Patescibacteria group bacterium]
YALGTSSTYELTSYFESDKYQQTAANSGNPDPTTYAIGSNLSITPFIHGLVGYWPLNEGSGSTAKDESGWGNDGTINGSPAWVSGLNGESAPNFTTSTQNVNAAGDSQLNITQAITMIGWVSFSGSVSPGWTCRQFGTTPSSYTGYNIQGGDRQVDMLFGNGSSWQEASAGSPTAPLNTWTFMAATFTANGDGIGYYNGTEVVGPYAVTNLDPNIGSGFWINDPASGSCNEAITKVRIYNRALTAAQIQAIYNAEKPQ